MARINNIKWMDVKSSNRTLRLIEKTKKSAFKFLFWTKWRCTKTHMSAAIVIKCAKISIWIYNKWSRSIARADKCVPTNYETRVTFKAQWIFEMFTIEYIKINIWRAENIESNNLSKIVCEKQYKSQRKLFFSRWTNKHLSYDNTDKFSGKKIYCDTRIDCHFCDAEKRFWIGEKQTSFFSNFRNWPTSESDRNRMHLRISRICNL